MDYIKYFKSQAKKFYKDFQTQYTKENDYIYSYKPKFWPDIDDIIVSFDINEDDFSLMKAQHIVAYLAGFENWNELIHANHYRLEIGYYLVELRDNNALDRWQSFEPDLFGIDDFGKLDIFKQVILPTFK